MKYPAKITETEEGLFDVTFRDIPEALTCGDTLDDAIVMGKDALATAMDFYFEDSRTVPMPSKTQKGETLISLPASLWAKILLLNEVVSQKVSNVEIAKKLHVKPQEMTRLLDPLHASKIDRIEKALNVLGKELTLSIR